MLQPAGCVLRAQARLAATEPGHVLRAQERRRRNQHASSAGTCAQNAATMTRGAGTGDGQSCNRVCRSCEDVDRGHHFCWNRIGVLLQRLSALAGTGVGNCCNRPLVSTGAGTGRPCCRCVLLLETSINFAGTGC